MDMNQVIAAGAALSAFSGESQHGRLMRLEFPFQDGPQVATLLPETLHVREEVSRGFRIKLVVLSDDARIPLKMLMGRMVSVSLVRQDGSLRYFNGHVTEFRFLRTDGGFAFYHMLLEPWLAFTRLRKNCVAFHNKSVREITEETLKQYQQADWLMYDLEDDPRLTFANQYNETDYNHLHRRWEALGLHYWYEHRFDGHRLVLSDRSVLAEPIDTTRHDNPEVIEFRNMSGSGEGDGIREWTAVRRLGSGLTTLRSFDYKSAKVFESHYPSENQQGDFFRHEVFEDTGSYGFQDWSDGDKLAQQRMVALDNDTQYFEAAGNDRAVQTGRCFTLGGHFSADARSAEYDPEPRRSIGDRSYLILAVEHEASNNYLAGQGAPSHYENRFTCTRKDIRWQPGRNYHSEPNAYTGVHTARVVGPLGAEIHTDGHGRVKVQFHWDRVGTYDENSSPWIRVMTPAAGHQFGHVRLPRVGEEVVVTYPDGNLDHPLILGAVYNGDHMPPWSLPKQDPLSGLRSQELGGGTRGNHLVLDDTKDQIQVQLKSDHLCSQLSLGHITRIEDTAGRKDARGEGWELRTDGHGVLRAAKGMLITTQERQSARGPIKDLGETVLRLTTANAMQQSQAELAVKNGAQEMQGQQADVADTIRAQIDSIRGKRAVAEKSEFVELSEPHLVFSSSAGIATTTAQSTHIASDRNTAITTGRSVSISAGVGFFASIRETFRLFVQKAGIKFIAAAGDIDIKALSNNINLLAKLNITHTADRIVISARQEVMINGGGSYARFGASCIEFGTSGSATVHAASHNFTSAKQMAAPDLSTNTIDVAVIRALELEYVDADGNPLRNDPIQSHSWDGKKTNSTLDNDGRATIENISRGAFRVDQIKRQ